MRDFLYSLPPKLNVATPTASTVLSKSVIGRPKSDKVYCANTTALIAQTVVASRLNAARKISPQRMHARKERRDDSKYSRRKESWAWVCLL